MKKVFIILGALGVLFIGGIILFVFVILGVTKPVADAGDLFMTALKDSKYDQAYSMLTSDAQKEIVDAEGLQKMITSNQVQPLTWSYSSKNINSDASGTSGSLKGSVDFVGDHKGSLMIRLQKLNETWKVMAFNLKR